MSNLPTIDYTALIAAGRGVSTMTGRWFGPAACQWCGTRHGDNDLHSDCLFPVMVRIGGSIEVVFLRYDAPRWDFNAPEQSCETPLAYNRRRIAEIAASGQKPRQVVKVREVSELTLDPTPPTADLADAAVHAWDHRVTRQDAADTVTLWTWARVKHDRIKARISIGMGHGARVG